MKIAVDLRSLQSPGVSGVENYTINLLEHLLKIDKDNQYVFFYNSIRSEFVEHLQYVNAKIVQTRIPNKFLNLSLKYFKFPKFESLIGEFDLLFLPNANHFALKNEHKLVVTVHDLSPIITPEFYNFRRRVWHRFLNIKKLYERADSLLAVSDHTRQDLIEKLGISSNKIKVVYPGVNHSVFEQELSTNKLRSVRNIYGLPGEYILFLSTLEPRKNVVGLIKAFENLDSPNTHLLLVGKLGWKYKNILDSIEESKKKRLIKYLGYVEETDKPAIINMAKALIYPSFYEGFGFVPLEAMSLNVPVVTSQFSAIPEVVGDSALLINPKNQDDLTVAMSEILNNESLRQSLIAKGRKRSHQFKWEETALKTLAVFNSLENK